MQHVIKDLFHGMMMLMFSCFEKIMRGSAMFAYRNWMIANFFCKQQKRILHIVGHMEK